MKKGFTLVELLGVIVILGIISVLVVPLINNLMLESKEKIAKIQERAILKAAENWGHANIFLLPECENATCEAKDAITITLGQVMHDGFLDEQTIADVKEKEIYSEATEIVINKKNNKIVYSIGQNKYEGDILTPKDGPSIILSGPSTVVIEAVRGGGDEYSDLGVTAKDNNGNPIECTVTIKDSNNNMVESIPNNVVSNYKIIYEATADGKTAKNIRNVQIVDTTAPTISFVNHVTVAKDKAYLYMGQNNLRSALKYISPSVSSNEFQNQRNDFLSKISNVVITDNSCESSDIEVKITSTVEAEVGTYKITYKATDKYNNSDQKTRTITIIDD